MVADNSSMKSPALQCFTGYYGHYFVLSFNLIYVVNSINFYRHIVEIFGEFQFQLFYLFRASFEIE